MAQDDERATVVVIGSGFGGTMTALSLAREFKRCGTGDSVLMLERGTWWSTPVETVADKTLRAAATLESHSQPVQFWSSAEHFKGFIDIFTRCLRRRGNVDGLYDLTNFGRRGLFGALSKNDGVSILRASGVGGGSLVYANVTIRPPEFVLEDKRWPKWDQAERDGYFARARDAIGKGVLWALDQPYPGVRAYPPLPDTDKGPRINTGVSRIATRTAGIRPQFASGPGDTKRIDLSHSRGLPGAPTTAVDSWNALWIDRARVFQTAMSQLEPPPRDFGTCESSINDIDPDGGPDLFNGDPQNYCERQGRCIIGCLPGARHTLNKQLMKAMYKPDKQDGPLAGVLRLKALCEVKTIKEVPGGYEVRYLERDPKQPQRRPRELDVIAKRVVIAAGTVGTNELLLRCRAKGTLPGLSDQVGHGFSTNGDSLQFLENCPERLSLTRGPVTTSYAHFEDDEETFHTIEDNGIPRALTEIASSGVPLIKSLSKGRHPRLWVLFATARYLIWRIPHAVLAVFRNAGARQPEFASEDERTSNMMCVATMGREASIGVFRLGRGLDTTLRLSRPDHKEFKDDDIYRAIDASLKRFAEKLGPNPKAEFRNPFTERAMLAFGGQAITLSHPLGGCRMAADAGGGVVDRHGRVFDARGGAGGVYDGLYVADGARIPTALGVNPSLTISALALRTADAILDDLGPPYTQPGMVPTQPVTV